MRRVWFIIVPLGLAVWTFAEFDLEQAVLVALLSFVSGALAFLFVMRMNWRGANLLASVMAIAGLFIYALVDHQIREAAKVPRVADAVSCPPDGCRMIVIPAEPEEYQ